MRNKVVRNAGWLIAGNITYKLIAFIIGLWTARYLGPSNQGVITYAAAYTGFFYSVATLGINSIVVKQIIDNPDREGTIMGTTLVLQCVASLFSALTILCIVSIVDFGEPLTIAVTFLSSLGLFFQVLDSIKYWFQAKLESKYAAIATIVAHCITSLYRVVLLILKKGVLWFAFANVIDCICVAAILFTVYKRKKGPKFVFSKSIAKELIANSRYYILSGLMISIYGATDKIMLKQMLNAESVGYYGTAISICTLWVFVLSSIIESISPVIMEAKKTDEIAYKRKNVQLYSIVFYLSIFVSLFMTIFAEWGVVLLYGKAYQGAVNPLRIVCWYVAFSYLGCARDVWVVCEGHQRHLPKLYMEAAITNVVLNFALIPFFGASGAAAASLITQISTVFIAPLFIKEMRPNVCLMLDAIFFRKIKRKEEEGI